MVGFNNVTVFVVWELNYQLIFSAALNGESGSFSFLLISVEVDRLLTLQKIITLYSLKCNHISKEYNV